MNYRKAVKFIREIRAGRAPQVSFVSPAVATLLAASRVNNNEQPEPIFINAAAAGYASISGLEDAIKGRIDRLTSPTGLQGQTYSKLTMLFDYPHVESCTATINSLFTTQLAGYEKHLVWQLNYVVGELHDNVVSHAKGSGFSAAQTYAQGNGHRVCFSIADAGVGFLANYRRSIDPNCVNHGEALSWCLKEGNTTAKPVDKFAQALYPDAVSDPFGGAVAIRIREHSHKGYGLAELCKIVDKLSGNLWIWTGDVEYTCEKGKSSIQQTDTTWPGVAIEMELYITPETKTDFGTNNVEDVFCGR